MRLLAVFLMLVFSLLAGCGAGGGGSAPSTAAGATTASDSATTVQTDPSSASSSLSTPTAPPDSSPSPAPDPGPSSSPSPAASPSPSPATAAKQLYVALFTHTEDHPDFMNDPVVYASYRDAIVLYATRLHDRGVPWSWQCDYNFLEACLKYEVQQQDAALLSSTAGQNVFVYLHDQLGVELDPHSHENNGYNYADVAYLLTLCGVQPSPVVGGFIYDPNDPNFQDWTRFLGSGLQGAKYPQYTWRPSMLMGGGTANHVNDPVLSGMWHPASVAQYFTDDPQGTIADFGVWDSDPTTITSLLTRVQSDSTTQMWTAAYPFNHSSLATPGYIDGTAMPIVDSLKSLADQGQIRFVTFMDAYSIWQSQYGGVGSIVQGP